MRRSLLAKDLTKTCEFIVHSAVSRPRGPGLGSRTPPQGPGPHPLSSSESAASAPWVLHRDPGLLGQGWGSMILPAWPAAGSLCTSSPGSDPLGDATSPWGAAPEGSGPHLRSPRPGGPPSSQQTVRKPALGPGGRHYLVLRGCFRKQLGETCPAVGRKARALRSRPTRQEHAGVLGRGAERGSSDTFCQDFTVQSVLSPSAGTLQ